MLLRAAASRSLDRVWDHTRIYSSLMCGRYTIGAPTEPALRHFGLDPEARQVWESLTPRYNVAPTQVVPVLRLEFGEEESKEGRRALVPMRWGLIPSWADDMKMGSRLINARRESVAIKPAFRSAFKHRRCLVPATGFFEWSGGPKGPRQPFLIRRRGTELFAFAGLFEIWSGAGQPGLWRQEPITSFTILTGPPNEIAAPLHDRMPIILPSSDYETWLDPLVSPERLEALLVPYPAEEMEAVAVGKLVNNPRNEDPACIEPLRT